MSGRGEQWDEAPVSVEQIVGAISALGMYHGENTPEEHAEEAARLGGPDAYRVRMVNALLGMMQTEAAMADGVKLDDDVRHAAWEQQLTAAGAGLDDPVKQLEFIRWQVLRAGTPLRLLAQNQEVGSIPLAAAHTVIALHTLLGVIAASQNAACAGRAAPGRPGSLGDGDREHRHPAGHAQVGRPVGVVDGAGAHPG